MVRVPRGCQRCLSAQLKCDGKSPCSRCRHLRAPCPDPSPHDEALQLRYQSDHSPSFTSSQSRQVAPVNRSRPAQYSPTLPIDESLSPSLAVKATSAQQTEVFTNFVLAAFPCYFRCTERRVSVNWIEYVDSRRGSKNGCFDWAIRACTTTYTGFLYNDLRFMDAARALYTRSLRGLAGLLSDISTAKSDEALATAIALAVFEKHNCTSPNSWLRHAEGIKTLMRLRGPDAHLDGFGRAMYIVYRNFLVTAALVSGEECFLEQPEWQALNEKIVTDNAKLPDSSSYTEIAERGFREITKIPGYVKRVRELLTLTRKKQTTLRPALLQSILGTRAALRGVHTEFGVSVSMVRAGHGNSSKFIGPLPYFFFDGYSTLAIRGVRSGMLILNYLVLLLDPKQRAAIEPENQTLLNCIHGEKPKPRDITIPLTPPKSPGRPQLIVQSLICPETKQPPTSDWMDRIVTTMGMDGVFVGLLD